MNLYKGFRKIAEDEQKAVLEHENGHQLNIAKSGLSRKHKAALSKLPLYQASPKAAVGETEQGVLQQPQDAGVQAKVVGANIADAVASKILEGAEEVATPTEQLKPEQIAKMPEAVATDVQTGMPVSKGVGRTPEQQRAPLPPGPLAAINPFNVPDMMPGETGDQYAARKQREYDEYYGKQQQAKPGLAQQEPQPTGLASTQAPQPVAAPAPQVAPTRPIAAAAPSLAPTAPAVPVKERTPEEVLMDPKAELSEKLAAENKLYQANVKALADSREQEKQILSKLEPKRVFSDASIGNKILMAISVIAGGVGAGLTGKENAALRAMDDIFARDWEAQKLDQSNRLTLHKINQDALKDEMASRLQTMANFKSIMVAKMEEAEGKYGFGSPAQKRIELARLQLQDDIDKLKAAAADRQTSAQIKRLMSQPSGLPTQATVADPAPYLKKLVPDEKLRERLSKEISRRKAIVKTAPIIMDTLAKVFQDYGSIKGQTVGRVKEPESVKDLENEIRGIIPEQAGDVTGQQRETQVQALLKLLKPGPGDVFDKKEYSNRLNRWLQQNVDTPAANEAGINLDAFPATAIRPETWGGGAKPEQGVLLEDVKTKNRFLGTPEQAEKAIQSGKYRRI